VLLAVHFEKEKETDAFVCDGKCEWAAEAGSSIKMRLSLSTVSFSTLMK